MVSEDEAHPPRCGVSEIISFHHGPESIDQFRRQSVIKCSYRPAIYFSQPGTASYGFRNLPKYCQHLGSIK